MAVQVFPGFFSGSGLIGPLLDRIGARKALILCYPLNLIPALLLAWTRNELHLYMLAIIFGFGFGGRTTLELPIASGFFGLTNLATILAILETAFGIGGFIGPYLAGYMSDLTARHYELFL